MPDHYPLVIVGAGPAGLLAGIAAGSGALLLERNSQAGRKLLLSGSGQCNFTNTLSRDEFLSACGRSATFLKPAWHALDNIAFREMLDRGGCPSLARPDGKVFPASMSAQDVLAALLRLLDAAEAQLRAGIKVEAVRQTGRFELDLSPGGQIRCDRLVLAGGGCSYPQTGSDGSVLTLAKSLGHTIRTPRPALAPVRVSNYRQWSQCAGISLKRISAVFSTSREEHRAQGDLLWTHTGLSGPLILDNSHLLAAGDTISLLLVPRAADRTRELVTLHSSQTFLHALKPLGIPEAILRQVIQSAAADPAEKCANLPKDRRNRVAASLERLSFTVAAVEPLASAMASSGGVPLSELRARDLSSKCCPGLYLAGELLDYDLPTGGFNIQMAASTGYLAGSSALQSLPERN